MRVLFHPTSRSQNWSPTHPENSAGQFNGFWKGSGVVGVPILIHIKCLMHVFIITHRLGAQPRHFCRKFKLIFPASLPQFLHCPPCRSSILEVKLSKFVIRASNVPELATNCALPLDHSDILERTKRASERSKLQRYHDDCTKITPRLMVGLSREDMGVK